MKTTKTTNAQEIIAQITMLLAQLANAEETPEKAPTEKPLKMLSVKECAAETGLSEHTIRLLITQKKIPHIRAGESENGKIFVPREALANYINSSNNN